MEGVILLMRDEFDDMFGEVHFGGQFLFSFLGKVDHFGLVFALLFVDELDC